MLVSVVIPPMAEPPRRSIRLLKCFFKLFKFVIIFLCVLNSCQLRNGVYIRNRHKRLSWAESLPVATIPDVSCGRIPSLLFIII